MALFSVWLPDTFLLCIMINFIVTRFYFFERVFLLIIIKTRKGTKNLSCWSNLYCSLIYSLKFYGQIKRRIKIMTAFFAFSNETPYNGITVFFLFCINIYFQAFKLLRKWIKRDMLSWLVCEKPHGMCNTKSYIGKMFYKHV